MKLQTAKHQAPPAAPELADLPPCKPHATSTHTDTLPMVYRRGSLDATKLPTVAGGVRTWPDGRKEPI